MVALRSNDPAQFQLRYCPALSKKPGNGGSESEGSDSRKPKPNPFENPAEGLLVARLPNDRNPTHNLVLNKYPVIHRHSILSTYDFKKQTDFLDSQDLDVTYSCLQAWEAESTEKSPSRLFAFFNSGEHSGASQAHRHLQLLPVEDMMHSESSGLDWQPLIDLMTEPLPDDPNVLRNPSLSFRHYAMKIPENPGVGVLQRIYHHLYECASKSVQSWNEEGPIEYTAIDNNSGEATVSYNLAMTIHAMAICPRRNETAKIPTADVEGSAAVNGTILGGTLMVKELSDWEVIQQDQVNIDDILTEIGIPSSKDLEISSSARL
jgi:sulfate adenylyltransferase (ADP) / ATP adenylyltransferase